MRIAIIGQGYVGTSLGRAASKKGYEVIGLDNNENRIANLKDIGYQVSMDWTKISDAQTVVIAVPTPLDEHKTPDLSFLVDAVNKIKVHANQNALVINESTSFPGTLRHLISPILAGNFKLAVAPERIDPNNRNWDIFNTPRVVGAMTPNALEETLEFYGSMTKEVIPVSSPEVAEAAKLFENTFRQINIALVNEFAQIANSLGIPTVETLKAAATKPFGFMSFMPGLGVGGHCIPVDPIYLSFAAKKSNYNPKFIDLADEVNSQMPYYILGRILDIMDVTNKKIQIAGISYKSDTDDVRESPALELLRLLREQGADVTWHDDKVARWNGEQSKPIAAADIGIICTYHQGMNFEIWTKSKTLIVDVSISAINGISKFL